MVRPRPREPLMRTCMGPPHEKTALTRQCCAVLRSCARSATDAALRFGDATQSQVVVLLASLDLPCLRRQPAATGAHDCMPWRARERVCRAHGTCVRARAHECAWHERRVRGRASECACVEEEGKGRGLSLPVCVCVCVCEGGHACAVCVSERRHRAKWNRCEKESEGKSPSEPAGSKKGAGCSTQHNCTFRLLRLSVVCEPCDFQCLALATTEVDR